MSTRQTHHLRVPLLRVLIATYRTQGQRSTDFAFVPEGELVTLAYVCDRDRGNPDGGCGCTRGFADVSSHKVTTTAVVVEQVMTRDDYLRRLRASALDTGLLKPGEDHTDVDDQADELLDLAAGLPIGTVVERRGDLLQVRQWPPRPRACPGFPVKRGQR
ncbi:hypothetical protein MOQ72_27175 [Saccharopolyspora sp. K220]|uniref:DUF7715 family protein n=1 Tax=Saccharopolyspora soli TaxID=2926618 RepID=UPI001F567AAE|nr:hypothetical protein [Saccharopolyspora soli]MCI2421131.1 hypothetical protein [Saccharopolyspora soli]